MAWRIIGKCSVFLLALGLAVVLSTAAKRYLPWVPNPDYLSGWIMAFIFMWLRRAPTPESRHG